MDMLSPRWPAFALVLLMVSVLGGCATLSDSDEQRLCRSLLPALLGPGGNIRVGRIDEFGGSAVAGLVVRIDYEQATADGQRRQHAGVIQCSFEAGRGGASPMLAAVTTERGPLGPLRLHLLRRYWIDSGLAAQSDPAPVAMLRRAPALSGGAAVALQQLLASLPLISIYALLATAYALLYGLVGRINLAFGDLATLAGYAAFLGFSLLGSGAAAMAVTAALAIGLFAALQHGAALSRWVIEPLARAPGQHLLIATIGVSIVWQEALRLTQGAGNRWLSPLLNRPIGVAHAGAFVVTVTPMALVVVLVAATAAVALVITMRRLRFGLHWRASADDPVAAAMMGIDQRRLLTTSMAVAALLAGLGGVLTTLFYGGVGYSGGLVIGLKALIAAIVGGIGSIGGALCGAILVGAVEAMWSAAFAIELRDPVLFIALVVVLWWKPSGLFGHGGEASTGRL